MSAQGCTLAQIAAEMGTRWGYRPRQAWRHAHGWTQAEVAARYNQLVDSSQAAMTSKRISDYESWPQGGGGVKPTLTTLSVLALVFETAVWELVDWRDRESFSKNERVALASSFSRPSNDKVSFDEELSTLSPETPATIGVNVGSSTRTVVVEMDDTSSRELNSRRAMNYLVKSAADESRRHADHVQGSLMPEATLDEITAEVERLTKEYLYSNSYSVFSDAVHARNRIYQLLEMQQYPRQRTHLYYLASITCYLLADTSLSIGSRRSALEQARASGAYAEIIGHNSLRLKCRGMEASLAYWDKRPQLALNLVLSATPWATEPIAQAALYNSVALFSALTGRPDESRAAMSQAFEAFDRSNGNSDVFDRLGGVFSYPRGKLLQVSGIICLELGDLGDAETNAMEAIYSYEASPAELRAFGTEALARIDGAQARLVRGDIEGAEQALRPVLDLPSQQRVDWLGIRLKDFHSALNGTTAGESQPGSDLIQEIEAFCGTTISGETHRTND
jgi:transcriptional regulator with XRE-family HTH domain